MTNFYYRSDNMTENFNTRLLGRFGMQDITTPPPPPPPPHISAGVRQERWRPPSQSSIILAAMFVSACGGGGGDSTPATPAPPELHITPEGSTAQIKSDGAGLLGEEIDGSASPVALGTIGDSKNTNGEAYYKLAEDEEADGTDNAAFEIIGDTAGAQILRFKGTYSGDLEGNDKLTLKIIRYNNKADAEAERNPQILDYIVNLINFDEALTITNADGDIIASDGEGLLPENYNGDEKTGGSPFELGEIGDNGEISLGITYRLADTPANADYQLERADEGGIYTYKLYYTGKDSGDFEAKDFLIVDVIRTIDGTDQPLKYLVNLTDVAPDITGYEADGTTEIAEYGAGGNVGDNLYAMSFGGLADGAALTISFVRIVSGTKVRILPQYDPTDSTKLIGFQIAVGDLLTYGNVTGALNLKSHAQNDKTSTADTNGKTPQENFDIWAMHKISVNFIGTETLASNSGLNSENGPLFDTSAALPITPIIEVNEGTSGTIANFFNGDGRYSLGGDDGEGEKGDFTIDADGNLRFKVAPNFDSPTDKDTNNFYEVSVTADDGTNSDTYDLLVVVADIL